MSPTKRGNDWYFGSEEGQNLIRGFNFPTNAHIGIDADSGVRHSLDTSAARLHDSPEPPTPDPALPAAPPPTKPTKPTKPTTEPAPLLSEPAGQPDAAPKGDTVYTPEDSELQVETTVVDADDLLTSDHPDYPADLQPRDRDRAASQTQIEGIANKPSPLRLDQSPETDRGSPVVGPDGRTVESGNGRTIGLRRAYERGTAEQYRAYVVSKYPQAAGMKNPVIVRKRLTDTNATDFAIASNQSATLQMSASEEARSDARLIDTSVLGLYRGGGLANLSNRPMITSFIAKLPQTVQGKMITKDGGLTIDGQRRFQSALFYRAYGDERMLERRSESLDDDIRSVTSAMTDEAGRYAKVRDAIERGEVSAQSDVTPYLVEAIRTDADLRQRGQTLDQWRRQTDAFAEPLNPLSEQIMGMMFNPAGTRLVSKKAVQDFFAAMADEVMDQKIDQLQMPGIDPNPIKSAARIISEAAIRKADPSETPSFFERGAGGGGTRGNKGGSETQSAQNGADGKRPVATAARQETLKDAGAAPVASPTINTRPKGSLTPGFMAFSFTNRTQVRDALLHGEKTVVRAGLP